MTPSNNWPIDRRGPYKAPKRYDDDFVSEATETTASYPMELESV